LPQLRIILAKLFLFGASGLANHAITIEISDERLLQLQETATRLGVSIEELVLLGVEELVNKQEESFKSAINYVLNKNAGLYHRLA